MRDLSKMSNNLEEILKNASSCVRGNDANNNKVQARYEVLDTLAEMKDKPIIQRLNIINKAYQGVDLEATLNISPDYYRERYFALLEIVAKSIKTDK